MEKHAPGLRSKISPEEELKQQREENAELKVSLAVAQEKLARATSQSASDSLDSKQTERALRALR